MENQGATVVIQHHVAAGKQLQYEAWLNEIGPICRRAVGNIDWQIVRPIAHLTFLYTVIIRFDTIQNLKDWMESDTRKELIEKAKPLFTKDDKYYIQSGLDFLFLPGNESQKVPVRWKQYLVTWSAIYPLSLIIPLLVIPVLGPLGWANERPVSALVVSGVVVFMMVYVVMPNYTRLIRKWLYR